MNTFTKDEILKEADELAKLISSLEEVKFYQEAEQAINQNDKVQQLISQIKKLQKQSVNLLHYGKTNAYKQNEEQIQALQDELDQLPIVSQFKSSQVEVNELLQEVTSLIEKEVAKKIDNE